MNMNDNSQSKRSFSKQRGPRPGGSERRGAPKKRSFTRPAADGDAQEREDRPRRFDRKPAGEGKRPFSNDRPKKSFGDKPKRSFGDKSEKSFGDKPARSFGDKPRRSFGDKPSRSFGDRAKKSFGDKPSRSFSKERVEESQPQEEKRPRRRDVTAESAILSEIVEKRRSEGRFAPQKVKVRSLEYEDQVGPVRLNKYISNAGVCSRREADTLIAAGAISVNGQVVTEMGFKVLPTDEVRFGDKVLQREKPVYILLNKPKDYITTMEDEFNRNHVMQLIKGACKERVYPVGRLDRMTTGLLLFTNDGEMAKKLTHPRSGVRKIYHVTLDKNLKSSDMEKIADGLELEDGDIQVDEIAYVGERKNEVGVTIHSGRNRIVRRMFESLDYRVEKLDRVIFAGLTKKDLPRGSWRFLTEAEVNILKMSIKGEK